MEKRGTNLIPAVLRTLDVIECLFLSDRPKSNEELAKETNIPPSSLYRLLKTLASRYYVTIIEGVPYKYVLGYKALELVTFYHEEKNIIDLVNPIMESLSFKTNQTVQYAIFYYNEFIYIAQELSNAELNYIAQLYKPLEINSSACAKIMIANMPEDIANDYLDKQELKKRTHNSIVDMEELKQDLLISYNNGYATDNEEFAMGIGCLAVPIFNKSKKCLGAIGVTGPIGNYKDSKKFQYTLQCVQEAAQEIEEKYNGYGLYY